MNKCKDLLLSSKKVKVKHMEGIEGAFANAEITANAYGKNIIMVNLLFEQGTYQIESYKTKKS